MAEPNVVVTIPTYNERGTLAVLVEKVLALGVPNIRIVVVDDNSPDGTGELGEILGKKYPVRVIHRTSKEGLGRAYIEGFADILKKEAPDFVIQIDADLSHDPTAIPSFLEAIHDADVVLGSRYIQGGGVTNWNIIRRAISRGSNAYSRLVLGLPYRDLTGGFKCYRADVLRNLDLESLASVGYNFQIETTYRAHKLGYRIKEIPIVFTERKLGSSKFNVGIIIESFVQVLRLRLHG